MQENEVIMFSKTTCPFCSKAGGIPGYGLRALMALESWICRAHSTRQAKEVLQSTGSKFVVVELDELPEQARFLSSGPMRGVWLRRLNCDFACLDPVVMVG